MNRSIRSVRRARRHYKCDNHRVYPAFCGTIIAPGDQYTRIALTPDKWGDVGNSKWLTARLCCHCADIQGSRDDEETAKTTAGRHIA